MRWGGRSEGEILCLGLSFVKVTDSGVITAAELYPATMFSRVAPRELRSEIILPWVSAPKLKTSPNMLFFGFFMKLELGMRNGC